MLHLNLFALLLWLWVATVHYHYCVDEEQRAVLGSAWSLLLVGKVLSTNEICENVTVAVQQDVRVIN